MNLILKMLVLVGSSASIAFGFWDFFVPKAWDWYSCIEPNATEVVAAVRAINAFFSLSLVLFGAMNMLRSMETDPMGTPSSSCSPPPVSSG